MEKQKEIHVISFGGGVQSTTMLFMAIHGEIKPKPDFVIFADTGWEPEKVYKHVEWVKRECEKHGVTFVTTSKGNIKDDMYKAVENKSSRYPSMPFYLGDGVYNNDGKLGRQCTNDYKIQPIRRELKKLLGYGPRQKVKEKIMMWIGISWDEVERAKSSKVKYIEHRHPLLEKYMNRMDCMDWMKKKGYPVPPKSSCIGCPFHDNYFWRDMKENDPDEWKEAVEFDKAIKNLSSIKETPWLHRTCKPLDKVYLQEDQLELDMFINECTGYCGV